ncbi:hypothetical protein G5B37_03655 [Rasiella rasia]|uniref:Uncharacterized protein n=1 Tax=Rasiella rasia TaxID=2744027 RepID=A0A6G6GJI6_9FLAO|nr:hypothetical protein [Rasiella rasia]QIE58687.1 hypothetical protein G5B37_03655 [Rasiella rasia]
MRKTVRHIKKRNRFSIIFPILTIIAIGILFTFSSFYEKSWSYNWNGISEQIRDSIKVAEYGGISSGVVGVSGRKPKQFDRRIWIMKNATEKELLNLTEYPSGTIKAIAYEGLLRRKDYKDKTSLVLKSLKDTEYPIEYQSGCLSSKMYVGEYLINQVLFLDNQGPPLPESFVNYRKEKYDVDKIMKEYLKLKKL